MHTKQCSYNLSERDVHDIDLKKHFVKHFFSIRVRRNFWRNL
jgi:hypothetical protein